MTTAHSTMLALLVVPRKVLLENKYRHSREIKLRDVERKFHDVALILYVFHDLLL